MIIRNGCRNASTLRKLIRYVGYTCVCLLCYVGLPAQGFSQPIPAHCVLTYDSALPTVDSALLQTIRADFRNDTLALAYCVALSHYPELQGYKIRVKYRRIKTSMAAVPRSMSVIFRKADKRTYLICVNKRQASDPARIVATAPFNAQVGVFGHELAHVLDYSQKSGWQVVGLGVRYLSKRERCIVERETDSTAMAHGLHWQVYHYAYFVFNEADISDKYRRYKREVYMSDEEILRRIAPR